jgi:hypothetical protein
MQSKLLLSGLQLDLISLIQNIQYPANNDMHEQTAADGYAYLGAAKALLGLDYFFEKDKILERLGTVVEDRIHYGTVVPAGDKRVYQTYACFIFAKITRNLALKGEIIRILDSIGAYSNGMMRYCQAEINLVVPNITALSSTIYNLCGREKDSFSLLNVLSDTIKDYGWDYIDTRTNAVVRKEDAYHLALMLWALSMTHFSSDKDMLKEKLCSSILRLLQTENIKIIQTGSIMLNFPFLTLATYDKDVLLYTRASERLIDIILNFPNFRTKGASALALTIAELGDSS